MAKPSDDIEAAMKAIVISAAVRREVVACFAARRRVAKESKEGAEGLSPRNLPGAQSKNFTAVSIHFPRKIKELIVPTTTSRS
jgi:hypothetical protein